MKKPASSFQLAASSRYKRLLNFPGTWHLAPSISSRGFTLIETLVAVTLLSVAITAPMSLTTRSLAAAYYARDQITAFHLAQEAIESVRHARDHNILLNAQGTSIDLLDGVPNTGSPFTVNTLNDDMQPCPLVPAPCPPLQVHQASGGVYGYRAGCPMPTSDCGLGEGWENTRFTRSVRAEFVQGTVDEVRISVRVEWQTGAFQKRWVDISENLYRWVSDGSAS